MHLTRFVTVTMVAATMAVAAMGQFNAPAPVAWRFLQPTSVAPGGAPLVVDNTIYQSVGGRVFSIDKESGNLLWRFPQVEPIPGVFRYTPARSGNTIVAAGDNKIIYAFDAGTGALKWSLPAAGSVYGPVVAVGEVVVYATSDNKLNAVNVADGKPFWETPLNVFDTISGQMASEKGNLVFFNGRQELVSLDITTRKANWKQRFTQLPPNPVPVIANDTIYAVSGPYLIAINPQTGTARWQVSTGLQLQLPPAASADGVFVVSQDGKVLGYRTTREPINKVPIDLGTVAVQAPTASGSMVVVPTGQGGIALVDPAAGAVIWNYLIRPIPTSTSAGSSTNPGFPGGGPPGMPGGQRGGTSGSDDTPATVQASGPAAVAGNMLIVPAKDGSLIAFDRDLGVDFTAPVVKMVFPNPGEQVSGQPPLVLAFRLTDEASGINEKSILVEIDGEKQETTLQRDGLLVVRFSLGGPNKPMADGRRIITVTVKDWVGNERKQAFSLTIDNTLRPVTLPGSETGNSGRGPGGGPPGGLGGGRGGGGLGD